MIKLHIGKFKFNTYLTQYQIEFEDGERTLVGSIKEVVEMYYNYRIVNHMKYITFNIEETREYNSIQELKEDFAEEFI